MKVQIALAGALMAFASPAGAQAGFTDGPIIRGFGAVAKIDSDLPLPPGLDYKIAYDVEKAVPGKRNKGIDSAARLLNMLAANGVPKSKIHPAVVIHGDAIYDVLSDERYGQQYGMANPSKDLVRQLIAQGVPIYVCGQQAAWSNVDKKDFLPGVKMALSAMNAHAILHSQGYMLNPF
jgi:intracellular sulfur oxidation DsrE/DsrF family protein